MDTRQIQINEKGVKSEEKLHTHPLQEKRKENFMSLANPVDDDFLCHFCEDSNYKYMHDCPLHALIPVQDPHVFPECEEGLDSNYCRRTLPQGLAIKKSNIEGAGLGVFSTKFLPARTRFGPYIGKKEKMEDMAHHSGYSWQVFKDGKPSHFVNAGDSSYSNWMRFVNCARNENEQCVTAYQHEGEIYYRTNKDIYPGTELLVYYGDSYAKELGINIQAFGNNSQMTSSKQCNLPMVDDLIIPKNIDHVFDPSQEDRTRSVEDPLHLPNHIKSKDNDHHCRMKPLDPWKEKVDKYLLQNLKKEKSFDLANHLLQNKTQTGEKPFKCDVCEKAFTHSGGLTKHKRIHSGEKPFKCDVCGKGCAQSGDLTKHKRTHSGEKPFKCDVCGKHYTKSGDLTIHKRSHSGEKPFKCDVCVKGFTNSSHLTLHKRTHSGEKPFKCDVCGKGFSDSSYLTKHKRTHSGEKPFKCDVCGMGFTDSSFLNRHRKTLSGEKPFHCDVCGKGFTWSYHLTDHKRTHSGEKPFKCDVCGKGFTQSGDLTVHKRTHSGEKPFKCDVCGKGFTTSGNLTVHKRTHTGEKPFKCDVCGKGFTQSSVLTIHNRTHSGEKPFKCDVCGKGFKNSSHLTVHKRTHLEEKPFKCDICCKGFINSSNLSVHKKTH